MQETRTEMTPTQVVYRTTCDGCGKTRDNADLPGWHHFSSHHHEWGNDSIDSYEYHDACSFACYLVIVAERIASVIASNAPGLGTS